MENTSIILTIHNQESIIKYTVFNILQAASFAVNELIVIYDGCTDNSEKIVNETFESEHIKLSQYHLDNVFETRANNFALKKVTNPYAIIVQDDCWVTEPNFDFRLTKPFRFFPDIFAVSARNAHNISYSPDPYFILNYPDCTGVGTNANNRDILYIRQCVNRGPLALKMDTVRELGYFSEEIYMQNGDDHLLCLDAYKKLDMRCGCYPSIFVSKDEWGGTRQPLAVNWINEAIHKNQYLIKEKHPDLIGKNWNEERLLH